jgi:hypothetical protein
MKLRWIVAWGVVRLVAYIAAAHEQAAPPIII